MIVSGRADAVKAFDLHDGERIFHVSKRVLIGPDQGARNFVMREFTLGVGGSTPYHTHAWEHEVYVVAGSGTVVSADGTTPVSAGDYVFVPPRDEHQFKNSGEDPFAFLCVVPPEGEG